MFDVAREPEVVRTPRGHRDAHAGPVDVGYRPERRPRRREVSGFDLDVGCREADVPGPGRLCADQAHIPDAVQGRIGQRVRPGERDIAHRHAQVRGDLTGQVRRNAHGVPVLIAPSDQQGVASVDRRTQDTRRGELGCGVS